MSAESRDDFSAASAVSSSTSLIPMADESLALSTYYTGIPFLVVPPSPARVRRVSFSEDESSAAHVVVVGNDGYCQDGNSLEASRSGGRLTWGGGREESEAWGLCFYHMLINLSIVKGP